MSMRRKVSILVSVVAAQCAAMLAVLMQHVRTDASTRYRMRHKPLAGPRSGARLPR